MKRLQRSHRKAKTAGLVCFIQQLESSGSIWNLEWINKWMELKTRRTASRQQRELSRRRNILGICWGEQSFSWMYSWVFLITATSSITHHILWSVWVECRNHWTHSPGPEGPRGSHHWRDLLYTDAELYRLTGRLLLHGVFTGQNATVSISHTSRYFSFYLWIATLAIQVSQSVTYSVTRCDIHIVQYSVVGFIHSIS